MLVKSLKKFTGMDQLNSIRSFAIFRSFDRLPCFDATCGVRRALSAHASI